MDGIQELLLAAVARIMNGSALWATFLWLQLQIEKSKKESLFTVVSIFVNPKQFNNKEDFNKYPITINEDIKLLKSIDCDLLYMPTYEEIYPSGLENIDIPLHDLDKVFEGEKRPGHFAGVAAVVHRLFSLVEPHKAFLD
jgi:pantoate--beta-alanine ligase